MQTRRVQNWVHESATDILNLGLGASKAIKVKLHILIVRQQYLSMSVESEASESDNIILGIIC